MSIYKKNNFCTKIAALKLLHSLGNVENQFGPGVWPYVKRMVNKQKGKNKAKTWKEREHAPQQE